MTTRDCEYCKKDGVPILPVRYAVAPLASDGSKFAPDADSISGFITPPIPVGNAKAHYTARILRSGFLYVYEDQSKYLNCYYVSSGTNKPGAYYCLFERLKQNSPESRFDVASDDEKDPYTVDPCIGPFHREKASFITFPKGSGVIRLAYAEARWPKDILKMHLSDAGVRQKNMREFDVDGWLDSLKAPHAEPITSLGEDVCEYSEAVAEKRQRMWLGTKNISKNLEANAMPQYAEYFNHQLVELQTIYGANPGSSRARIVGYKEEKRPENLTKMIDMAESLYPGKGVILALDDPAGIPQYLNKVITWNFADFAADPTDSRNWKFFTATGIENLKQKMIFDMEHKMLDEAYQEKTQRLIDQLSKAPPGFEASGVRRKYHEQLRTRGLVGDRNLNILEDLDELDDAYRQATSNQGLAKIEEILKKEPTISGNIEFDGEGAWEQRYGQLYDETARQLFMEKYNEDFAKFKSNTTDALSRLYLRWLVDSRLKEYYDLNFSQKNEESGLAMAISFLELMVGALEFSRVCYDQYYRWFTGAADEANLLLRALCLNNREQREQLEDLLQKISSGQLDISNGIDVSGVLSGKFAETVGILIDFLGQIASKSVSAVDKKRALAILSLITKIRILRFSGIRAEAIAKIMEQTVGRVNVSVQKVFKMGGMQGDLPTTYHRVVDTVGRHKEFLVGVTTGFLAILDLSCLMQEIINEGPSSEQNEIIVSKLAGCCLAIAQGVYIIKLDALNNKLSGISTKTTQYANLQGKVDKIVLIGKGLGIVAGVAFGLSDIFKGISVLRGNNTSLGIAYCASGAIAIGAAIFVTTIFGGIIVIIIGISISFAIDFWRNHYGDEWLRKCYFGIGQEQLFGETKKYGTLKQELEGFEKAITDFKVEL